MPVHPVAEDQWSQQIAPGVTVAVDAAGCVVIHTPHGTITLTDTAEAVDVIQNARTWRDTTEARR